MVDRVAQRTNQRKADRLARQLEEGYPGVPTIDTFRRLPAHLKTRKEWWRKFDRKILPKERPKAVVLWKHEESLGEGVRDSEADEIIWTFRPEVITTPVPVFSVDQTKAVRKHARTKALEEYWDFFCRLSHQDYKVVYLPNGECRTWEGKITREEAKGHILGRRQFALRMSDKTHHVGIDHDLHAGDPDVFLRQLDVLLNRFWGKGTWHLQVKRKNASGVHFFRVFQASQATCEVVADVRSVLVELDRQHPELAADALAASMKPFSKMEVKPTQSTALRLPLAPERVMLLDRPLETVIYRRKEEQDVVGYIRWIKEALEGRASHMQKKDVFEFVESRLLCYGKDRRDSTPIIVPPQNPHLQKTETTTESLQKRRSRTPSGANWRMKGQSWRRITEAWSGQMEPDSLNHWIRQLSLYTPFSFPSQEVATGTIERFIDELPDWSFSDRLSSGHRTKVSSVIRRDVEMAFSGWKDQPDAETSARKLKAVWKRWTETGRNLFDKHTWRPIEGDSLRNATLAEEFDLNPDELQQLQPLCSLLASDLDQVVGAVKYLIRLIRLHPEVPRTWIVQLLEAQGIRSRSKKLDKPKIFIDFLTKDAEWIFTAAKHNVGRCRRFGLTDLMRAKFTPLEEESWWNEPRHVGAELEYALELESQLPVFVSCC